MSEVRTVEGPGPSIERVLALKGATTISLCLPCREEAATIGAVVEAAVAGLLRPGVVDELIVIDEDSSDGSAAIAERAGAAVVPISMVHTTYGPGRGKGNAMWASVVVSHGDIVVWCDTDVTDFDPGWVIKLVAPLLGDAEIALVKGAYTDDDDDPDAASPVSALVARPLLALLFPALAGLRHPLAGEVAARRAVLEDLYVVEGWGVEVAMLADVCAARGPEAIAQVVLGPRRDRRHATATMTAQAGEVMAAILHRSSAHPQGDLPRLAQRPPASRLRPREG